MNDNYYSQRKITLLIPTTVLEYDNIGVLAYKGKLAQDLQNKYAGVENFEALIEEAYEKYKKGDEEYREEEIEKIARELMLRAERTFENIKQGLRMAYKLGKESNNRE